nr:helix-turn-helix transcriptional regulator [Lachnospiraceae bacterium]
MTISERLFRIMEEKNISMSELSRLTGISRHTIFDWRKKNT